MSQTNTAKRPCPICQGQSCRPLRHQRFVLPEGHPLAAGYDVVSCLRCGFVYADSGVSQQDYDRFYADHSKYEDGATSTGGGDAPFDATRLHDTAVELARHLPDRQATILDIGCANGGLLRALHDQGFSRLWGIEPSAACAAHARSTPGVQIAVGSLFASAPFGPQGPASFDCVVLSHVLEHLLDVSAAAKHLSEVTRDGGLLYIEVPDAPRYADYLVAPFQDFNTEHINHFSPRSLLNLFGPLGFASLNVQRKTIFSAPNVPFPALGVLLQRRAAAATQAELTGDDELAGGISHYLTASQRMLSHLESRMSAALASGKPIIVWGTGQLAMKLLAETALGQATIAAFVDGNPINHGKILHGIPIRSPQELAGLPHPILVTSTIHQTAIVSRIRDELKLPNELVLLR
jgi:SAM-dependent methyltransferase